MRAPSHMVAALFLAACAADPTVEDAPDWATSIRAGITAGEYAPAADGSVIRATNRAQALRAVFDDQGVKIHPRTGTGELRLRLERWGREGNTSTAGRAPAELGACLSGGAVDAFGECLHRVEARRPGLVEWWENRPEGLEHGYTVTAPPDGDGALVFDLTVVGAVVEVDAEEARFARTTGEALRYAALAAWDERGRELPVWMEESAGGLRLLVDDRSAIGTITVDPLLTTSSWTAEADQISAFFGSAAASAGDVNGDGFGDVIVGAENYDNGQSDEGRVYVYHGSAAGLSATAAWTAESDQASSDYATQDAAAGAGDVNGDGYGDVIVGSYSWDNGSSNEGRAWVYLGSATGLASTAAWTAESDQASANFGYSVAGAGDVNGDGYSDVIVGAIGWDNGASSEGRAYVYLGSDSGLEGTASWTVESDQAGAYLGDAVGAAGDVNGDGYADVVVAASYYDTLWSIAGRVYVYHGSASGLATTAAWTADGDQATAYFGGSVASAGDVNGDGYADLLVSATHYDNGQANEGVVWLYEGSATGLETTAAWSADSDQATAEFGDSLGTAGDVNGDGYADVIIGTYRWTNGQGDEGRAEVYLGSSTGLGTTLSWSYESDQSSTYLFAAASAGDVNGDGFGDVVVGTPAYDNGSSNEGRATVYLGSSSGLSDTAPFAVEGDQASAELGFVVSPAGDTNGDGFADVIVGAPLYDNGVTDEGAAFVYLGAADGLPSTAAWSGEGDQAGAYFGWSAGWGDFDGNGYADIVIGAPKYDNGETDEGSASVYLGSPSGLATAPAWTDESDQASAEYGYAVAGAGDTNRDGYDEVLVGARYYDNGSTNEGRASLYQGSASGPSTTADWTGEANQSSAIFGFSVASAHDVNGDGYGDVVIGALGWNNGSTDEGRAYVFHGSASGLGATADWTVESNAASTFLGRSVASAGDVNGDGYADVIVGAPYWDNGSTDEGAAWVFHGSATGLSTAAAWTAEVDSPAVNFGWSVASAGDINGDGYGDVVIGAPYYDNGHTNEGRVYLYLGSSAGLESSADWLREADEVDADLGYSVASAGDVNGDGYADVIVGAYLADNGSTDEGRAYVYMGNGEDATGIGLSLATQARHEGTTTPISPGLLSDEDTFDVSMATARGHWGSGRVGLQIEAKALGTPFDGTDLETSAYAASGTGGVALQQDVSALVGEAGYHWRARVAADPSEGRPQGWGQWVYGGISGDPLGTHVRTDIGTIYIDADGDGYGDPATGVRGAVTTGYVADDTDCDDADAAINPGVDEVCDAGDVDEDCDGLSDDDDDGVVDQTTLSRDDDGDGYGSPSTAGSIDSCEEQAGYADDDTDCDEGDAAINPGAAEYCDGFGNDEDCDGLVDGDDPDTTDGTTWYADNDGDGYGDLLNPTVTCDTSVPTGYTSDTTDCDDAAATAWPGGTEVCDVADVDEDCDGVSDDDDAGAGGQSTSYLDADGDGYGGTTSFYGCDAPISYVVDTTDCDDTSSGVHPGATEVCDTRDTDEDCSGSADDTDGGVTGTTTWYADTDGDGYGGTTSQTLCEQPSGYVAASGDCDDTSGAISPAETELCDAADTDEDCDGLPDDLDSAVAGATTWYLDQDNDGYGHTTTRVRCDEPAGYTATAGDCDDTTSAVSPGEAEVCDAADTDEDCDGLIDDADPSVTGVMPYYSDADDDGYGTGAASYACDGPVGTASTATDCDDGDADTHPDAAEPDCTDPVDYNCDGSTGYADDDVDGYAACEDCDDTDASVFPGAVETSADGIDGDCDGEEICYADDDGDGYRDDLGTTVVSVDGDCLDAGEAGDTVATGDCDEADATIHPGATDTNGDGVDSDCDGNEACYVDEDGDGYRPDASATVTSTDADCTDAGEAPATASAGDCDDTDAAINPDATEVAGDGVDGDCDSAEDCYIDADDDGYRADESTTVSLDADCDDAGEALATDLDGDCDDADPDFHPGAPETDCTDPTDYNCDGSTGYADADNDSTPACEDCDDTDDAVRPGARETAGDAVDQDCDGYEDCYADADDDGYRPDLTRLVASTNLACNGSGEALATDESGDCDDEDAAINPGASEIVGDNVDGDCDGSEDCYVDADDDGYTADDPAIVASEDEECDAAGEAGADAPAGDCDDIDAAYNPGMAEEDCEDPADYNCDGSVGYADGDADGWAACVECDDGDAAVNPDADEVCNGVDDDCDDAVDVGASDATNWYADADGDGYTGTDTVTACDEPEGYLALATTADCDDTNPDVHVGAEEVTDDGIDQDCDGVDVVGEVPKPKETCGCSAPASIGWSVMLLGALAARRRRPRRLGVDPPLLPPGEGGALRAG